MKRYFYKSGLLAFAAVAFLTSCDPEIDAPKTSAGEANFTKYISVGNSLTAGYMDGGLYREGQQNSYPNILSQQFRQVGGGEFVQPLFSESQKNGSGYLTLTGFTSSGLPITSNVTTELAIRSASPLLYTKFTDPVNNLGVPDIRIADVKTAGYGGTQGNPYFERITSDPNQTYLQRIQASTDHTFFTNWLGNNDVLLYATRGGFAGTLTDVTTFTTNYTEVLDALTANGAKGLVATIPDVASVPFFTTAGPSIKTALTLAGVPGMVALTGSGNSRIIFPVTNIRDASGSGKLLFPLTAASYAPLIGKPGGKFWREFSKQVNPGNSGLVLTSFIVGLQLDTTQLFGLSSGNPWPSLLLLDETEQASVKDRTIIFNDIIKAQAAAKNLAVFDAFTYFNSIQGGFSANQVSYSPAFITGNLFSLDGVHPSPRGYAVVANEMIKAINAKYNAAIPTTDVSKFRAVLFPN